jgi:hypothetical protein
VELVKPVMTPEERDAAVIAMRSTLRGLEERDADLVRGAIEALQVAQIDQPPDPGARQLGPFARRSETSRQAALANYPRSGSQRMDALLRVAREGRRGATRDELSQWLGWPPNVVGPRVLELKRGGWLRSGVPSAGEAYCRRTRAGNDAEVLVLTDRARAELRRRGVRLA